jgi:hypothetical protein
MKLILPLPDSLKLTSSTTSINGISNLDNHNNIIPKYKPNGLYKVTSSSVISLTNTNNMPFNVFNYNDPTKYWQSDVKDGNKKNGGDSTTALLYNYPAYTQNAYNSSTASKGDVAKLTAPYQGGGLHNNTWSTMVGSTSIPGEWIQIELPFKIYLKDYKLTTPPKVTVNNFTSKLTFPRKFAVVGSNDGQTWNYVDQQVIDPTSTITDKVFHVSSAAAYSYFRLIISSMSYQMSNVSISSWFFQGTTILESEKQSNHKSGFMTLSRAMEIADVDYGNVNYMNSNNKLLLPYNGFEGFDTHGYVAPIQNVSSDSTIFDYVPGLTFTIYNGYHNENINYADTASKNTILQPDTSNNMTTEISDINTGTNGLITEYKNVDAYSILWSGFFYTGNTTLGAWTFTINSDDGSYLWVNNKLIVSNGGLHGMYAKSGTITLESTTYYPIKLLFGQNYGGHNIILSFTPPGGTETTNGKNHYFSIPNENNMPAMGPIISKIKNNQINPLLKISSDYSGTFNKMIQGSSDLSGNISKITNNQGTGLRDQLLANAQYDYSGSLFNFGKNSITTSDVRVQDTISLAEQETSIYTLGAIATVTLLIAAIYIGMDKR